MTRRARVLATATCALAVLLLPPTGLAARWHQASSLTPQARGAIARLEDAGAYGLRPDDYGATRLAAAAAALDHNSAASEADWAQFDEALDASLRRFVTHVHAGRVTPAAAGFHLAQPRTPLDVDAVLAALASADNAERVIATIEPPFEHYRLLKTALARYRALDGDPELTRLPPLPSHNVRVGDAYAGAGALGRLLHAEGDLAAELPAESSAALTPELSSALAGYQRRHGLTDDGTLGTRTYQQLTLPISRRVRQIELTLERWRWLPRFESPPIVVNIPEFRLFALRSIEDREQDMLRMNVIVGRAYRETRTPVFTGELRYVVFGPYWDVPRDIAVREILPKARAHPDYLDSHHFELVRGPGDDSRVVPSTAESIEGAARGDLRVRQRPGPDNPLGAVKFMLPNDFSVYLHGTPEQRLFAQAQRTFSHGCIRVSDPQALAERALVGNADGDWTPESIAAAMHGPPNRHVRLLHPIPIFILYGTAMASEDGQVLLFDDVYGYDRKLERLLHLEPPGRR